MHVHPLPIGSRYKRTWTLAGAIASFLTALPVVALAQTEVGDAFPGVTGGDSDTVVIVPFANISAEPSDDWIGSGIAETLSADFEGLDTVRVIAREALDLEFQASGIALPAADGEESVRAAHEAGRRLGAAWLVEGAYQRLGDRMRITARLIETATGAVAAGTKADGDVSEVFSLQDRIANELGTVLLARTSVAEGPGGALRRDAALLGYGNGDGDVGGNGNGNGDGALFGAPRTEPETSFASGGSVRRRGPGRRMGLPPGVARGGPAGPSFAPPGSTAPPTLRPGDVSGSLELGAPAESASGRTPVAGFAAAAGILTGRPMLRPTRAAIPPDIDGRLDDLVWRDALRVTEFVQESPFEGEPASEDTEVWISYDSQNLYLAFHAHYEDPGIMRATRVDRDQAFRDDNITVYFDPFLDQQRAYAFSINGYGVQGDEIINARGSSGGGGRGGGGRGGRGGGGGGGFSRRGIPRGDDSWDALFDSGAQIVGDGFTAEMAIPFKSLRYPQRGSGVPHRWAFQIVREIRHRDENVVWAPISRSVSGFLPQMGLLEGMTNLSMSRNLEIMPVATGIQLGSLDTSSGAFLPGKAQPEGGVNVKYGITSNLTADFTLNPDFSQVESDRPQIEVNQRFALFYPELRPFFLEGAEIFNVFGPVNFVHTRTIRDPDWGAKITGKVGRTSVGFLAANDASAGSVAGLVGPAGDSAANVVIGRARYDLYAESHIGAMVTNRDFLGGYSRMALADGAFRLGQTQSVGFTAVQTDNRDLDGIDSRGTLFDVNYRLQGRHWNIFNGTYLLSPDFRTDVGFVQRTDQQRNVTTLGYRFWPESWVINWGPSVTYGRNWNFDNVLEDEQLQFSLNSTLANNISANVSVNRDMERYLGVNFDKLSYRAFGRISSSRRISIGGFFQYGDEVRYEENPFLGRGGGGGMFLTVRPVPRFQSQINLNTSRLIDPRVDPSIGDPLVFDVTIVRAMSTYQFTDRLAYRNIVEFNTLQRTTGVNMLFSYRVNAGTVFYIGYDDRYQQGSLILGDDLDGDGIQDYLFPSVTTMQRTNRAFFTKFQYLFRY